MTAEGFVQAVCLAVAGLALAGWLILRRPIDLGRVTS